MPKNIDACIAKMAGKVDNEYAFCNWANQQGYSYEGEKVTKGGKEVESQNVLDAYKKKESDSASALAQLTRNRKKESMKFEKVRMRCSVAFSEADVIDIDKRTMPITIITEGLGNVADKHFYTKEALLSAPIIFEKQRSFLDHSTPAEEAQKPERSVRDLAGWISDVKITEDSKKLVGMYHFGTNQAGNEAMEIAKTAIAYAKENPGRVWAGLSIDANGEAEAKNVNGSTIKYVKKFTECNSVDIVTRPARGGQFNTSMLESIRENFKKEEKMDNLFKKNPDKQSETEAMYSEFRKKLSEDDGATMDDLIAKIHSMYEPADGEKDGEDEAKKKAETEAKVKAAAEAEAKKKEDEAKQTESQKLVRRVEEAEKKAFILESKINGEKKLKESGLPGDVLTVDELTGLAPENQDAKISQVKRLLSAVTKEAVKGAGAFNGGIMAPDNADFVAALKEAGLKK